MSDIDESGGTEQPNDRVHIGGKTFESTKNPPGPEEVAEALAAFAEFDRRRAAIPPEERFRLSDKFGGRDFDGTEFEEWVNEQQRKRQQDEEGRSK